MPDRDNNRDIRLEEARLRIKAGLEALAKGDFVEGTAAELARANNRSRKVASEVQIGPNR